MATVKKGDTVVLVGTRKGLFLFHSRDRKRWSSRGPYFEGDTIRHAILDPDDGKTVFAGVTSEHWGPVVGIQNRVTDRVADRKSTRLNSSHGYISYAVFCLKKKTSDL